MLTSLSWLVANENDKGLLIEFIYKMFQVLLLPLDHPLTLRSVLNPIRSNVNTNSAIVHTSIDLNVEFIYHHS